MRLLAFDTSTDTLSIAVQHGQQVWRSEQAGGPQSSRALLPEIQRLLGEAGLALRELEAIVYGCGPGAFTGLRTSCAVAQGLAFGAGVPALPVDSLQAMAQQVRQLHGVQQVMAVLDARMQEVYAAPYRWQADAMLPYGGCWQREADIRVLPPSALELPTGYALAGNAFGVYPEEFARLETQGQTLLPAAPRAEAMLQLAPALIAQGGLQPAMEIAPLYVRNKVAQTTAERDQARRAAG